MIRALLAFTLLAGGARAEVAVLEPQLSGIDATDLEPLSRALHDAAARLSDVGMVERSAVEEAVLIWDRLPREDCDEVCGLVQLAEIIHARYLVVTRVVRTMVVSASVRVVDVNSEAIAGQATGTCADLAAAPELLTSLATSAVGQALRGPLDPPEQRAAGEWTSWSLSSTFPLVAGGLTVAVGNGPLSFRLSFGGVGFSGGLRWQEESDGSGWFAEGLAGIAAVPKEGILSLKGTQPWRSVWNIFGLMAGKRWQATSGLFLQAGGGLAYLNREANHALAPIVNLELGEGPASPQSHYHSRWWYGISTFVIWPITLFEFEHALDRDEHFTFVLGLVTVAVRWYYAGAQQSGLFATLGVPPNVGYQWRLARGVYFQLGLPPRVAFSW